MQRRSFVKAVAAAFALPLLPGSKIEPDKFIMPSRDEIIELSERTPYYREVGFYGYAVMGCAVLDNRKVLLGTFE